MRKHLSSMVAVSLVLAMGLIAPRAGAQPTPITLDIEASANALNGLAYYFEPVGSTSGYVGQVDSYLSPHTFYAPLYCVLPGSDIYSGWNDFDIYPTDWVWSEGPQQFPKGKWAAYLYNSVAPAVSTPTEGAALQIALWEIIYDGQAGYGYDLDAGFFQFSSDQAVLDQATAYLNMQGQSIAGYYVGSQDRIGPIPEPGSLTLLGTALFGAAGLAWRKRKRS